MIGTLKCLNAGESVAWTQLALDLGYFDQAHFTNDFKKLVGCPPSEYALNGSKGSQMAPTAMTDQSLV